MQVRSQQNAPLAQAGATIDGPLGFNQSSMLCFVYASARKTDTYLWLRQRDDFEILPASLNALLGELRFVLEVELTETRRLPREDSRTVLDNLASQGWHLQLSAAEQALNGGEG